MSPLRRDALTLLVLCLTTYLAFAKGRPWTEATYQVQRSRLLVEQHALGSAAPLVDFDIRGVDGRYYEVHSLLNILVHVPIVAVDRWLPHGGAHGAQASDFVASMSGVVINSLSVMVFYVLLRGLDLSRRASLTTTVALAFGTMVFPYAGMNYEGNADVLFLLLAAHQCFKFLRDASDRRARHLAWCGLWCGIALFGRESNFALVALIGIAVLWDTWTTRRFAPLLSLAGAMLPFVLMLGWYNAIRTGTPFQTAITHRIGSGEYPFFEARSPYGILGLLASPGGSMFVYSPMAFLALFGIREAWRRFPRETALGGAFTIITIVSSGLLPKWFGLTGWGPRYMTPTLPFLLIALAAWLDRPRQNPTVTARQRALVLAFFVPAVTIQVAAALVNWQGRLVYMLRRPELGEFVRWSPLMFTIRQSQWWDAITSLCANIGHMITGRYPAEALAQVSETLSASSRYTTLTLDTWWNRLIFEGLPPLVVVAYLVASAAIVAACVASLRKQRA